MAKIQCYGCRNKFRRRYPYRLSLDEINTREASSLNPSNKSNKVENGAKPNLEPQEPQNQGANLRAFSETAQPQIRKVRIDLSDLLLPQKASAETILMELLRNYGVKVLVLVEFSSDRFEIIKDFFNTAKRVFSEEEDDDVAVEKVAEELTRLRFVVTNQPITVVTFYTGNETAVAFVEPYERTYT